MRRQVAGAVIVVAWAGAASAQTSASAYTTGYRYDPVGRPVGVIRPGPSGPGSATFAAERTSYNARGLPSRVERGSSGSSAGAATANDATGSPEASASMTTLPKVSESDGKRKTSAEA